MVEEIKERRNELAALGGLFQNAYLKGGGGFSALGRAHDMQESDAPQAGSAEVKTWFEDVVLGGARLSDTKSVYKPEVKVDEEAARAFLPRAVRSAPDRIAVLESKIKPLAIEQKIDDNKAPNRVGRGKGQQYNMGGANASAYAMLAGIPSWEESRWEWLHVRASSLGGKTDGSNLVVGTRDANTQMMPFESNIRLLGNIVQDNSGRYKKLEANFAVEGQGNPAKHKVDGIKLSWKLIKADAAPGTVKDIKGEAKFSPLRADASISKTEVGILETALKEERQKATED